jgi:hypothetical protein
MATNKPTPAKPTPAKPTPAAAKPAESKSRDVVPQQGGAIVDSRPDFLKKGQGRGQENVTHQDLIIPRLEVVQSLSPARDKRHQDYIEGAEEGQLYNSVTRELYGEDVTVVPVFFLKEWLVWKDRKKGGGFRGAFANKTDAQLAIKDLKDPKTGKLEDPDDYAIVDTNQMFCLLLTPEGNQQIVISMAKSKAKVARKWNSLIQLSGDDSFAKAYVVESVQEANAAGENYFNIKVSPKGYVSEAIYTEAEKLYELLKAGGATADRSQSVDDDHTSAGSADSKEF